MSVQSGDGVEAAVRGLRGGRNSRKVKQKLMKQKYEIQIKKLQAELKKTNKKAGSEERQQEIRVEIEDLKFKIAELNAQQEMEKMEKQEMEKQEKETNPTPEQLDELAIAKEQLKATKKEYQASMHDLKQAIKVSEAHLQSNYELISSLKRDKQDLENSLNELRSKLDQRETGMVQISKKRKELSKSGSSLNARSRLDEIRDVSQMESQHGEAIRELKERIEQYKAQINQCSSAMRQVHEDIDREKAKHDALRTDYQEHADRIESLTEALERCKQKNTTATEVLAELQNRYDMLKITSVQAEHKQEEEDPTKRINAIDSHTYHSLKSCNQRCDTCINRVNEQNEYILLLEQKLRDLIENEKMNDHGGDRMDLERAKVLSKDLENLHHENMQLKNSVKEFSHHRQVDEEMLKRHRKLEEKHAIALKWIDEMKEHHRELHKVEKEMGKTNSELDMREGMIRVSAEKLREMEQKLKHEQEKAAKCLYPGERDRLNQQIEELLKERNALKDQIAENVSVHSQLTNKLSGLETDNENLRIIKQRFEMDTEQMQKIVTQTSELNVELVQTRKSLSKKEKQLELLSQQLAAMIQRAQTLEEREKVLQEKLKLTTSPEDTEKMMQHLSSCRSEVKETANRFAAMEEASRIMREQLKVNADKVTALMQVVKDSEMAQSEWEKSRMEQRRLQEALTRCSERQAVPPDVLDQRIRAMEDVYRKSMSEHEMMLKESNRRLAELQPQIKEENVPMTKDQRESNMEERVNQVAKRARSDIANVQKQAETDPVNAAINAANLESVRDLQKLKEMHQSSMRQKEREIMATREDVYNKLLETLNVANQNDTDPNDLYAQIKDIRTRGTAREQQTMSDMLRLRAISARLNAEHQLAKTAQAELLHKANVYQRQKLLSDSPPAVLNQNVKAYESLVSAHRDFVDRGKRDINAQMSEQAQYIRELERQYPKMDAIVASADLSRFPNLDVLKKTVDQDRKFTVGAINFERKETISQDRTQSALEYQLKSLDASVRSMTDMVKKYNQQQTTDNLANLRSMAQMSPGQIQEEMKRQAEIRDRSTVRLQATFMPRLDGTKPGPSMAADMSTGEVQIRTGPKTTPPNKYFHSSVSVFGEPTKTFAPTIERAVSQFRDGNDLIAVVYSFEKTSTGQNVKYQLFKSAIESIFPRIQQLTSDGQLQLQLVRVTKNNQVQDLFGGKTISSCTYTTCDTMKKVVSSSIKSLLDSIEGFTNGGRESENHIVLSIGSASTSSHIHITDVLFSDEKVPAADDIRLLDGSWINFMSDVLQKPKTKIDLIYGIIPGAETDTENNDRLAQVMERVQTYLKQIKNIE